MKTGFYISGLGHAGLILWLLVGGLFTTRTPAPLEVTQVSIVSGEEYAALTAPAAAPSAEVTAPKPPVPRPVDRPADAPAAESAPETNPSPDPVPPAPSDPAPDISQLTPPPEAEVEQNPPVPSAPPEADAGATVVTETSRPREAPRVAPRPALPPPPDAAVSDVVTRATRPTNEAEAQVQPEQRSQAPEEATTEIVTEADRPQERDPVMTASMRPRARPAPPAAQTSAPAPESQPPVSEVPSPADDPMAEAVAEAVAQAVSGASGTGGAGLAPTGSTMTPGEKDALRLAVQSCWVIDPGSPAARVVVTVGMSLTEEGRVQEGSVELISNTEGDPAAVRTAFDSARRAILRCDAEQSGFDLPREKYSQWRNVEITFDPSKYRN